MQLRNVAKRAMHSVALMMTLGAATVPSQATAQSVPSACMGTSHECTAVEIGMWDYTHNTCGVHEYRATEEESLQDEIEDEYGSVCNLTTERIGWYTAHTPIGFCGVQGSAPDFNWGVEVNNISKYIFTYSSPCNDAPEDHDNNVVIRHRDTFCPGGYGFFESGGVYRCRRAVTTNEPDKQLGRNKGECCGNPINTAIANKYEEETDYQSFGIGALVLKRYYNSGMDWGNYRTSYTVSPVWEVRPDLGFKKYVVAAFQLDGGAHRVTAIDSIGAQWRHHYQRGIYLNTTPTFVTAKVYRHDGQVIPFNLHNGSFITQADINDKLVVLSDGRYQFTDADDETIETYLSSGQLESIRHRNGTLHTVAYDSCMRISTVADQFGNSLQFNYEHTCDDPARVYRIESITLPGGGLIDYVYDTDVGTLTSAVYPDGTSRQYSYGSLNGRRLTGITDESGVQSASWTYGTTGSTQRYRPITSQHAGGAGAVSIVWGSGSNPQGISLVTITDSLGAVTRHRYAVMRGMNLITSIERPHPSGSGVMDEDWTYDANGNVATYTDNRNTRTNYVFDLTRNLETSRTEAIIDATGLPYPESRTITTQWHPTHRLPTLITEPGRSTEYAYDANGNMLTKTTTDTATSAARAWTWTYDSYGRMLTEDGPRTDVADVTTYTYYTCATGNGCGQLHTITNAVGHVTTYLTYNAHGQPLTILDSNDVLITLAYDGRQRLTSRTVGGEATGFAYWPTGLLKRVTAPDGSFIEYTYDAAHRLTEIADSEGNSIVYTLDAMGNRSQEQVFDPSSALARSHYRTVDNLNRLKTEIGSANVPAVTTTFTHDNNGNLTQVAAPLGRTTAHTYDKLDRINQTTDAASGITVFAYDGRDNLTSVTDPLGLVTSYLYNGFDNMLQLTSPDTGVTINTFDSGGNLKTSKDARNKTGTYSYDALNRVTSLVYNDQTITYTYDAGTNQKGRLTGLDSTGADTSWTYDGHGRVLTKTQVSNGITKTITYQYNSAGQLEQITTPSNKAIVYGYANGKVSSITVNGTTLLNNVVYEPFGPVAGWTWGNSTLAVRTFDLDGRIHQIDSAELRTHAWDDANRITSILDAQSSALDQSYGYDLLDRLTGVTKSNGNQAFTYDANGNRLSYTDGAANSTYTITGTSNRLSSILGSQARTYSYNAVGAVTGDGSKTFAFSDRERIKSATIGGSTWNYYHNGFGERVRKKLAPTGNHYYMYDEDGHLIGEYNGNTLIQETVWLGDIPVATLRGSSIYYVHTDHLDAPKVVTQPSNNAIRWRWDRDPFGTTAPNQDPSGLGTFTYNLRLAGQFYDSETGLNYNYFRDYEPAIGRYVQSDPIGLDGGMSTYAYALGNPVMLLDPLGLLAWSCISSGATGVRYDGNRKVCRYSCAAKCEDSNEPLKTTVEAPSPSSTQGSVCYGVPVGTQSSSTGQLSLNPVGPPRSFTVNTSGPGWLYDWLLYPSELMDALESAEDKECCTP